MSHSTGSGQAWEAARAIMGADRVLLGPQASYQWRHDPKHLLFVLARYKHAARLIGDAPLVLEVGCGEGIGARILGHGRLYVGIDPDRSAIEVAAEQLWPPEAGSRTSAFDLAATDLAGLDADVRASAVVALDVLEHVYDQPGGDTGFVRMLAERVRPGGICVVGTPNVSAERFQSEPSRAAHGVLYNAADLAELLTAQFSTVQLFGMNDEVLHTGFLPMAHYLIGVGIGPRRRAAEPCDGRHD